MCPHIFLSINTPMKIDKFLQLFVVKEKVFYPLYIEHAQVSVKAASYLVETISETDREKRISLTRRIKECEVEADAITLNVMNKLQTAFVTPLDREDMHRLISTMDSMVDMILDCAKKFSIYQPQGSDQKLVEIADYIKKDTDIILDIVQNIEFIRRRQTQIADFCEKIKEIEHMVDDIYEDYMSSLFSDEKNVVELVKKKNIVQALEDATDLGKNLADVVRTIIVKVC